MKGTMTATFAVEGYDPQKQTLTGVEPEAFEVGLTTDGTVVWSEMGTTLMLTPRGWARLAFCAGRLQAAAREAMERLVARGSDYSWAEALRQMDQEEFVSIADLGSEEVANHPVRGVRATASHDERQAAARHLADEQWRKIARRGSDDFSRVDEVRP